MLHCWKLTIPQLTPCDLVRRAYLYVPDVCEREPEARFPVLYMFDGQNVFLDSDASFGRSWRMLDYLQKTEAPVIVAAVESNPIGNNRLCEYSPFTHGGSELGLIEGRGRITMDWLVREFKPFIDANCPTLPDREHTALAGSSMGGLMSLYAACHYSDVFSRFACLSPSLWVDPDKVKRMLRRAHIAPDSILYLDYGEREIENHEPTARLLPSVFQSLYGKNVRTTLRIVPGGTHCEASWEAQIPVFMACLGLV